MTIGERIKMRRKQLHMTADQVAELVGVNRATVYRYESGDIENMGTEVLVPLAAALRTTPAWLMGWEDDEDPEDDIVRAREYMREEVRALADLASKADPNKVKMTTAFLKTIMESDE